MRIIRWALKVRGSDAFHFGEDIIDEDPAWVENGNPSGQYMPVVWVRRGNSY
jgi:hypothetical protein